MADWDPFANEIFMRAIEAGSTAERAEILDRSCRDDAELRRKVEALLMAHDDAGSFLDHPAPGLADVRAEGAPTFEADPGGTPRDHPEAVAPPAEGTGAFVAGSAPADVATRPIAEEPGMRIGPYKLLQQIGEGGMGVVYMAEQEQPVRRRVALKVIKPGMDTAQVVARFEAERQALALMDHPNIARVLDAGATASGRPFFVMELVNGIPITEYCDQTRLTPRGRLELFVPVCRAIQHAHQKGVIHRDIKPSNVMITLVDGQPTPRVIDFGVAKATGQRLTERSLFTQFGAIVGTLEYMSPEQAELSALDVDTRSDVFSLGVLLYELLTGSTPLERSRLREAGFAEILRRIREEEPPTPSTRLSGSGEALPSIAASRHTEPTRLARLIRGELDWIAMRALEKDRSRRYDSAGSLAADVERYLADEAVEACPASRRYRLGKFARKHRAALVTASVFAAVLLAATAISLSLAYWATRERDRAVAAEKLAKEQQDRAKEREQMAIDAVKRFGEVIRETPELKNNPALAPLRTKLLKEPQAFFKTLRDRLQADKETTPDSLRRLAHASFDLGLLSDEIGDKQDALRAYEESLAIRKRVVMENPSVAEFQSELAFSHHNFGDSLRQTGRLADALASQERARAIFERLAAENTSVIESQSSLATSLHNIGNLLMQTGRPADALASFERARAIFERLAAENPSVTEFRNKLASSLHNIGNLRMQTGRPADALASHERAHALFERLAAEDPSVPDFQSRLASSHYNIGFLRMQTGRPADALASYERARALFERLAAENPSVTEFRGELAKTYLNIGLLLSETGRPADALAPYKLARAIRERLAAENPSVTEFQNELAKIHLNIGVLLSETGRPADALASYEQARAVLERLTAGNPSVTEFQSHLATSYLNIGVLLRETARPADALASYERARALFERLAAGNPLMTSFQSHLATSHNYIGVLLGETGRSADALASHERAHAIFERLAAGNPSAFQSNLATSHNHIGSLLSLTGRPADALASFERARAIFERLAAENPSITAFQFSLASSRYNIGILLYQTGRPADALASYEQARAIRERLAAENLESADCASNVGATLNNMALIDLDERRFEEARARLKRAIESQRKALASNPKHPIYREFLRNHLRNLVRACEELGRADEADQARRELAELAANDPAKAAVEARLAAVPKGQATKDDAERLRLPPADRPLVAETAARVVRLDEARGDAEQATRSREKLTAAGDLPVEPPPK